MMREVLDIYDERGRHIGVKERGAVHRDGDWHRVFHCWVVWRDECGRDLVLFQRRGAHKATFPLFLGVSVGGHYSVGEAPGDGLREMREELGFAPPFEALVYCGQRRIDARWKGLVDREIADTFVYVSERPLTCYPVMQPEVADLVAAPVNEGLELFAGSRRNLKAETPSGPCVVALKDFVPHHETMFTNALLLARQVLNGERNVNEQLERQP
ncbi:MAG: NUDIX domain-containing protein [Anaerolineaceae bacterium]|nr:NUDIX domain-containing protein [Anaerolineaceae bacterium]